MSVRTTASAPGLEPLRWLEAGGALPTEMGLPDFRYHQPESSAALKAGRDLAASSEHIL